MGDTTIWIYWYGLYITTQSAILQTCTHLADVHVFGENIVCGWCQHVDRKPVTWDQSPLVSIRDQEAHYEAVAEWYGESGYLTWPETRDDV